MNKINYQKELDQIINRIVKKGVVPKLLMHSCCAPCSSYCLEYLSNYFEVTVLYYNPNIFPEDEYFHRVTEQKRLVTELNKKVLHKISFVAGKFEPDKFFTMAKGLELEPEGGKRCYGCFTMRLKEAAEYAKKNQFDYFTTTLTISPLKNADTLNAIGKELELEYAMPYLVSDFKKKNGYKRSTELSKEYNLYRQDYCGCVYSKANRKFETDNK